MEVQVYADPAREMGAAAAGAMMAGWLKDDRDSGAKPAAAPAPPPPVPGWDGTNQPPPGRSSAALAICASA